MTNKTTRTAQIGTFPVGRVEVPVLPAINATTVLFPDTASLAPIDPDSLRYSGRSPYENFYYGGVGTPTTEAFGQAVGRSAFMPSSKTRRPCSACTSVRTLARVPPWRWRRWSSG